MKVYVVMKGSCSPATGIKMKPHKVMQSIKKARVRVEELNAKATRNVYWYESVDLD